MFHRDNTPAHKAEVAIAGIQEVGFELHEYLPYSQDLAPMEQLRGWKFYNDSEVIAAVEVISYQRYYILVR